MWSSVLSLIFLLTPLTVSIGVPSNTCDSLAPTQRDEWNLKRRYHIYDNCSIPSSSLIHLVDVLRKVDKNKTDCAATPYLGVIGPMNPRIQVGMERFLKISKITYFPPEQTSLRDEIKATSTVLLDFKQQLVAVVSATKTLEDEFRLEADKRNICSAFSVVLNADERLETLLRMKFQEISATGMQVGIVFGSHINLGRLFEISVLSNSSNRIWLMAGLDTKDSMLSTLFGPDHPGILFRKSITSIPNIDRGTVEAYEFGGKINRLNLVQSYIEYVNGCINNSSGSDMNEMQCQNHHFMAQNPQWSVIEETVTKLLDGVRKGGYLGNATEINRTADISNEQNQTVDEVEIWTFQHVVEKFSRPKELLKSLMETVYGALEYIGRIHPAEAFISAEAFTSAEAFISAVGFISAVAMIGLPAVANAAGFKRSGIETPSLATIIQALFFQGRISGRSGFLYSRLQAIGMRGFLSLKEQLFVTTVCSVIVLFCKIFSFITLLCGVIVLLVIKFFLKLC